MNNLFQHKIAIDYWLEKTARFEPSEIVATGASSPTRSGSAQASSAQSGSDWKEVSQSFPDGGELSRSFLLDEEAAAAVRKVCNDKDAGIYVYFLAALHILAYKYTSVEDIQVACAAPLSRDAAPLFLGVAIDTDADVRRLV